LRHELQQLAEAIHAIERPSLCVGDDVLARPISSGWLDVDETLCGGLRAGQIHEWLVGAVGTLWLPPLHLLIHLVRQAIQDANRSSRQSVIWIGKSCWPYGRSLVQREDRKLLDHSILVDPPDDASRLWAIDLALHSSAVAAVIADGSRLDMAASRRLQLAAETGRALALLARPLREQDMLSASATRWRGETAASCADNPRWIVSLLRRKGVRPSPAKPAGQHSCWLLEYDHATGTVRQSSHVAH